MRLGQLDSRAASPLDHISDPSREAPDGHRPCEALTGQSCGQGFAALRLAATAAPTALASGSSGDESDRSPRTLHPLAIDERRRLDWLQAMRGVAALAVVMTHARFQLQNTPMWGAADRWLGPAESGVDLFFVISGFVMVYTTRNDPGGLRSAKSFAIKRLSRVWPAYAVITIVAALLNHGASLFSDTTYQCDILKSLFFIPTSYGQLYGRPILVQGWTLNFEMYFYLVMAVCLTARRLRWAAFCFWFFVTLLVAPILSSAPSLTSPFVASASDHYPLRYMAVITNPIIWEFVGGAFAGLAFSTRLRFGSPVLAWAALIAAASIGLCFVFYPNYSHGPTQWGACYLLVVLTTSIASKDINLNIPRIFVTLGNISYTLYLIHLLAIDELTQLLRTYGLERQTHTLQYTAFAVVLSIVLATICHRFLENTLADDFKRLLQRLLDAPRRRTASEGGAGMPI